MFWCYSYLLCCGRLKESWQRQKKKQDEEMTIRWGRSYQKMESQRHMITERKNTHFRAYFTTSLWTGLKELFMNLNLLIFICIFLSLFILSIWKTISIFLSWFFLSTWKTISIFLSWFFLSTWKTISIFLSLFFLSIWKIIFYFFIYLFILSINLRKHIFSFLISNRKTISIFLSLFFLTKKPYLLFFMYSFYLF